MFNLQVVNKTSRQPNLISNFYAYNKKQLAPEKM